MNPYHFVLICIGAAIAISILITFATPPERLSRRERFMRNSGDEDGDPGTPA
jgi:hypothetical protein